MMKEQDMVKTIKALQSKIMVEENVSIVYAAILTDNALNRFDPRVREGVLLWLNDHLTGDFAVKDISVTDIQDELEITPFQALCVMDMYLKNPDFITKSEWFLKGAWS